MGRPCSGGWVLSATTSGEIVEADLSRVQRAAGNHDFQHAELAARDLAARLRQPDPSFSSQGRGAPTGGEAGGSGGASDDEAQSPDDVERAYSEAQDLERLVQDHAGQLGETERALSVAATAEEQKEALQEAAKHAKAIRDAVSKLPRVSGGSQSWTSKGIGGARSRGSKWLARSKKARPEDALESGRKRGGARSMKQKRMLERGGWLADPTGAQLGMVADARRKIEAEARWAEEQVHETHRRAGERARSELQQGGVEEEKLAEQARDLAQRGRDSSSLPQEAIEAIGAAEQAAREAAEALKQGDGDRGLDRQREAQRALEQAESAMQGSEENRDERSNGETDGRAPVAGVVDIPRTHKGSRGVSSARHAWARRACERVGKRRVAPLCRGVAPMRRLRCAVMVALCAAPLALPTRSSAQVDVARQARELIVRMDLEAAGRVLVAADPDSPPIALERARPGHLRNGLRCGERAVLARPDVQRVDDGAALADVAHGCARATAAVVVQPGRAGLGIDVRVARRERRTSHAPLLSETVAQARDHAFPRPRSRLAPPPPGSWWSGIRFFAVCDDGPSRIRAPRPPGTVAVAKWGRVTLLSPRATPYGYVWRDTVAHELTHLAVTRASGDRAPLWLQEGVAKYEESRWRPSKPFDDWPPADAVAKRGIESGHGIRAR